MAPVNADDQVIFRDEAKAALLSSQDHAPTLDPTLCLYGLTVVPGGRRLVMSEVPLYAPLGGGTAAGLVSLHNMLSLTGVPRPYENAHLPRTPQEP